MRKLRLNYPKLHIYQEHDHEFVQTKLWPRYIRAPRPLIGLQKGKTYLVKKHRKIK